MSPMNRKRWGLLVTIVTLFIVCTLAVQSREVATEGTRSYVKPGARFLGTLK